MDDRLSFNRKDINRLFVFLVGFAALLIAAFFIDKAIGSPIWLLERLVNIDGENSFPSWFSSTQLFLIGFFLFLKACRSDSEQGPARWFYLLGAGGFMFLSADEALLIHESITQALLKFDSLYRFEDDHGMWIPFYLGTLALLALLSWRQVCRFWECHRRPFLLMAAGAGTFLFGAVGLEITAYELIATSSWVYLVEVAAEEFLEMVGASIILYGSLDLLITPAARTAAMPVAFGAAAQAA